MKLFTDSIHKIAYATDASVYRQIPHGVAFPETDDDVRELIQMAKQKGIDLIPRAAGTSIAGQVVGSGIVVDISRHWNRILEINAGERWARVQPGVVRDELNIALKPYGLFFSPETSTSNRCCIGGMFGNNSCGTHSLVYGSTRHHVVACKGILSDGSSFDTEKIDEPGYRYLSPLLDAILSQLEGWAADDKTRKQIETNYPDKSLQRRSCGYAIDEAVEIIGQDKGLALCKLLAGSEGTLAFITEITVTLDPLPPKEIMVVCGHCEDLMKSFEGNLVALRHQPTAVELMDGEILELSKGNIEQSRNRFFVDGDPAALLITELRADTSEELDQKADALEHDLLQSGYIYKCTRVYGADVAKVWNLRKAGLGILSGMKGDAKPTGVIEDTAVAPRFMPAYMRDFRAMLDRLGAKCVFYGHISTGELHLRPIINLKTKEGRELFRAVAYETALIVRKHRGTISGEHGDGRLRGEFIPLLYGNETYELMRQVKQCWDKDAVFNRHKIVDTLPMDSMLRYDENQQYAAPSHLHPLVCSIEQCNGAADCRKSNLIGGTMCPAFKVSGDETKSTRARANIIREVLTRGGDMSMVKEVLDSCLACKACSAECPSNVDITRARAELLQYYYDQHGTPLRTWLVARVAWMEQLGRVFRPIYNFAAQWTLSSRLIKHVVGFAKERSIPQLSRSTMRQLVAKELKQVHVKHPVKQVLLYADEFTNQHEAELGLAFARLLMRLGYQVEVPDLMESGRAAISKGCLKRARHIAQENVRRLSSLPAGFNLVGIEPSAILTFRDEYPTLVPSDIKDEAARVGQSCLLYDEFLQQEIDCGNISPDAFETDEMEIWLHGHCHQKALVGIDKTVAVMKTLLRGATVHAIPSGCCGMAGSFGYEKEHYKTSIAIGEMVLFPTIRKTIQAPCNPPEGDNSPTHPTFVAAPGTSCRQQILDGTGVKAVHPIEILSKYCHL